MSKLGELRASQLVTSYGPGALVDLPEVSAIVASLETWPITQYRRVPEPRLQQILRTDTLYEPTPPPDETRETAGVPVRVFPTFLVCPHCRLLGQKSDFEWDGANYICREPGCRVDDRTAEAFPARF